MVILLFILYYYCVNENLDEYNFMYCNYDLQGYVFICSITVIFLLSTSWMPDNALSN